MYYYQSKTTIFFKYACIINTFTTTDLQGMPRSTETLWFVKKNLLFKVLMFS